MKKYLSVLWVAIFLLSGLAGCQKPNGRWSVDQSREVSDQNYLVISQTDKKQERWYCSVTDEKIESINLQYRLEYGAIQDFQVKVNGQSKTFESNPVEKDEEGVVFFTPKDYDILLTSQDKIEIAVTFQNAVSQIEVIPQLIRKAIEEYHKTVTSQGLTQ